MAVEQGFATAQFNLGNMYSNGRGVPQNDAEAVRWYRMAAEQGLAEAQFNLGIEYDNGRGVPKNEAEAVRWYRMAAEQGLAEAQFNLGIYDTGRGVPQNDTEAVRWYRMAAEQGFATAQFNLGNMYSNGRGIPKNDAEQCDGIAWPPSRDLPRRSSIWVTCMPLAKAFPRITYRPMPGITLPRHKATKRQRRTCQKSQKK